MENPSSPTGQASPLNHRDATIIVENYLVSKSPELARLAELKERVWKTPAADDFFQNQRQTADHASPEACKAFYHIMKSIGRELHARTDAFTIRTEPGVAPRILDMCMAPGGFLETALTRIAWSSALVFTLNERDGHPVLLPSLLRRRVQTRYLDVTMLAADMGVHAIPEGHTDARRFLPRQIRQDEQFHVALCDGQVLRTHQRSAYRERAEATRLTCTQLALGLDHLVPGGTMIILLHKLESYDSAKLVWTFSQFAEVQLWKPAVAHRKRSSFYLVARNVRSQHELARQAVARWKAKWRAATFASVDEYRTMLQDEAADVQELLDKFGDELVERGADIWAAQADALAQAEFLRADEAPRTDAAS